MGIQILIHARDLVDTDNNKGDVAAIRSDEEVAIQPWGTGEALPDFVLARVANLDKAAALKYQQRLTNKFSYTIINSNAQGRRYEISMNPRAARYAETVGFDVRSQLHDLLVGTYNATVVSVAANKTSAVFDIPNTNWAQLRADAREVVEDLELPARRYTFANSAVDTAIANGGVIDVTVAQLIANLTDQSI